MTVGDKTVQFGRVGCAVVGGSQAQTMQKPDGLNIQDKDFEATFDGNVWTVRYFWKESRAPQLRNKVAMYNNGMQGVTREHFNKEVDKWIEDGILLPWDGEVDGVSR